MHIPANALKGAILSPCGTYRYLLERVWEPSLAPLVFCGLNPSTADASEDDPTIRKCMHYANAWGCGGIKMLNLFAYRTVSPEVMVAAHKAGTDVVGPQNHEVLVHTLSGTGALLCMWGNVPKKLIAGCFGRFSKAMTEALETFPCVGSLQLLCLGTNQNKTPKHLLYLSETLQPEPYSFGLSSMGVP